MRASIISAEAEAASRLLFRTLGAHRTAVSNLGHQPQRRRLGSKPDDREQIQCQATLLRLLSITESFCAERLLGEIDGRIESAGDAALDRVWQGAAIGATRTWSEQQRAFKAWLDVQVDWKPIDRLAEARNAVAHGLGALTRQQRRKTQAVTARIRAAGLELREGRVWLTDASLAIAAATCREVIELVDLEVQRKRGSAHVAPAATRVGSGATAGR
jgi:hypothetical protein